MAKTKLTADQQANVVQHVIKHATDITNATQQLRNTWLQLYKNYRIFKARDKEAWQSKLWIPKTFTAIEQIASRTTAHNPRFNLKALQSSALQFYTANQNEIDEAIATNQEAEQDDTKIQTEVPEPIVQSSRDILEAYLIYIFYEQKLKHKIRLWDKGRLIYGSYHTKIDIEALTETRVRESKDDEGNEVEIEEKVLKALLPDINTVDVFDFLIHPFEQHVDTAYCVIHKNDNTSINELDQETYFNLDLIDPSQLKSSDYESDELAKRAVIANDNSKKIDKYSFGTKEYWGRYSLTGEAEDVKEYIITVAFDKVLIRFEENKYRYPSGRVFRPFVGAHNQPVPGEYYAIGDAEPIMSLQDEMNHLRNTRQDFNNSVLYPEWLVQKDSGVNPLHLQHKPNNIILTQDMNAVQPLKKDSVPVSSYREEDALNRDIQETTSTTNFAQPGASSAFTDTASGASLRQQEQNTRMKLKIEYLDDAVSELGQKILLMVAHELEDNDTVEIPDGDDFHEVYAQAFKKMAKGFSPVVISGSMAADTPSEKRNQAIARGNISLQYQKAGVPVNLEDEYKNIMKEGFNVKDVDSLILNEVSPEVPQENNAIV